MRLSRAFSPEETLSPLVARLCRVKLFAAASLVLILFVAAADLGKLTQLALMSIEYSLEPNLPAAEFQAILLKSTLAERRPAQDLARLEKMLRHADLVVTARHAGRLVGISRAVTDFSYCCYLSDLAVDAEYQRRGIGKRLIEETHRAAGLNTTLILVAAPAAEGYYPKIGMKHLPQCWATPRKE